MSLLLIIFAVLNNLFEKAHLNMLLTCPSKNMFFFQGLPFKINCLTNEKKVNHNPTLEEPVVSSDFLQFYINKKHIAIEKTTKLSNEVVYFEWTHRYQDHSRPPGHHQHDPANEETPDCS